MSALSIPVGEGFYLSSAAMSGDVGQYLVLMNDPEVYNGTLRVPSPYTEEDARSFISYAESLELSHGHPMVFRIRDSRDRICGSIGLFGKYGVGSHKDEIGYWMGREHRNTGLMTKALKVFAAHVGSAYGVIRLEATIFDYNLVSQHVVQKCGFEYEGTLKKAYFKDGKYIDGKLFALVK